MENQRNFGALLEGNTPMNGMPTKERVELLPVDMIDPHPLNPRIVTPESLDEAFLESVERNGVLQPVFVKLSEGGRYQMLAGHRRLCASKVAKHIPWGWPVKAFPISHASLPLRMPMRL